MPEGTQPSIAIIGAGPAGLVTARILQRHGLRCTIFERDSSPDARKQGGVLDMHADGGQFAFRACELFDLFLKIARYGEQDMTLYDKHAELKLYQPTEKGDNRPEADRPDIRRLLLGSVTPDTVLWEHVLTEVEQATPGKAVTLHFRDRPKQMFDLVIGADGAWSRVRPLVSSASLEYTGVTFYEIHYSDEAAHDAGLLEMTRYGNMFALGDRKAINSHRTGSGGVHMYAGMWTGDVPGTPATRDELAASFATWAPALRRFITLGELKTSLRVIFQLPISHRWQHRSGVTLLGDAAHLMSPFSGEGANLAMRDAADLALAIVQAQSGQVSLDDAIADFEQVMCTRAAEASIGAAESVRTAFAREGVDAFAMDLQQLSGGQP